MRHSWRSGDIGRTASICSIGMNTSAEQNSEITNQSSPSENGVDSIESKCTVAPPSSTAIAAAPTPTSATRRLRPRRIDTVPSTNAATSPTNSRLRANCSV